MGGFGSSKRAFRVQKRISKEDISLPVQVSGEGSSSLGLSMLNRQNLSSVKVSSVADSGVSISNIKTDAFFDGSASTIGLSSDPRIRHVLQSPQSMSLEQLEQTAIAISSFKTQLLSLSAASDSLIRSLQQISQVAHTSCQTDPSMAAGAADVDYLIDTLRIISNSHSDWAVALEDDVEAPIIQKVTSLGVTVRHIQKRDRRAILGLLDRMPSIRPNDPPQLRTATLARGETIAVKVKKIQTETEESIRRMCKRTMKQVMRTLGDTIRSQFETYERLFEGIKKVQVPLCNEEDAIILEENENDWDDKQIPRLSTSLSLQLYTK